MAADIEETIEVLFLISGLTFADQVHIKNTTFPMPRASFLTEEQQLVEAGAVYYRPLTDDDTNFMPASESYLAPRAEAAQANSALITVDEAAVLLRVGRNTILSLVRRGVVTARRVDPTSEKSPWRIRRSSLLRYLDDDRLGDEELQDLGRPPRLRGSVAVEMNAAGGAMVSSAVVATDNEALASWAEEDADEPARPLAPNQVPHPLSKD